MSHVSHGWNTHKTESGFGWSVSQTEWNAEIQKAVSTVLKSGTCATRAQAMGKAKKWVLFFRRGGKL